MHQFRIPSNLADCFLVWLACATFVVACSAACGEELSTGEPTAEFFPRPTDAAARLAQALDKEVSLDFHETPLADVATWLQRELGVPVVLDRCALSDAGLQTRVSITYKLGQVSARYGLELMFASLDIAILEKEEYLLLTTQDRAETEYLTRVYPVGDLVLMESAISDKRLANFDSLIDIIITQVRPQAWGIQPEVKVMAECSSLVISQDRKMHEEVLQLLRALRAAKRASEPTEGK